MNKARGLCGFAAVAALAGASALLPVGAASAAWERAPGGLAASTDCQAISSISGTYPGTGATNGQVGTFAPGDFVTISATLGTATTATYRIVDNASGAPSSTLAGPSGVPGSLSYTVTGPLPAGSIGIGFFIDSANGTVNIAASCSGAVGVVPTLSQWNLVALAVLAALAGLGALRLRRSR
jgi:hypothetical protein